MAQGEWVKTEDTSFFRTGEMRSQWPLSFGFPAIEQGRAISQESALGNAEAEGLLARRMLRVWIIAKS